VAGFAFELSCCVAVVAVIAAAVAIIVVVGFLVVHGLWEQERVSTGRGRPSERAGGRAAPRHVQLEHEIEVAVSVEDVLDGNNIRMLHLNQPTARSEKVENTTPLSHLLHFAG